MSVFESVVNTLTLKCNTKRLKVIVINISRDNFYVSWNIDILIVVVNTLTLICDTCNTNKNIVLKSNKE